MQLDIIQKELEFINPKFSKKTKEEIEKAMRVAEFINRDKHMDVSEDFKPRVHAYLIAHLLELQKNPEDLLALDKSEYGQRYLTISETHLSKGRKDALSPLK